MSTAKYPLKPKTTGRKPGRPFSSPDALYAIELGLHPRWGARTIERLGGAEKLRRLDPSFRAVLLKYSTGPQPKGWGLKARGIHCCKPHHGSDYLIEPHFPGIPLEAAEVEE